MLTDFYVGSRVAVKLGVIPFFCTIKSCQLGVRNDKLWYIKYNGGVDEEEVLILELRQRQKLYQKEQGNDTVGNTKLPAREGPPPLPPSTTKKSNRKQPPPREL